MSYQFLKSAFSVTASLLVIAMLNGCSDSKFASSAHSNGQADQKGRGVSVTGQGDAVPNGTSTPSVASVLGSDSGDNSGTSTSTAGLDTSGGDLKPVNPITITGFQAAQMLNKMVAAGTVKMVSIPGDAAFVAEAATINEICLLAFQNAGTPCAAPTVDYSNAFGINGLFDGFSSCGDNEAVIWNAAAANFTISNACAYNGTAHSDNLSWGGRIRHGSIWMDRPVICSCSH